jgi:hypothetical protein
MLIEILENIILLMDIFSRGMPNDKKVNRNIELLNTTAWFKQIYSKNEELFKKDADLRYIVGWAKAEKSLKSKKRTDKLRRRIMEAINDR